MNDFIGLKTAEMLVTSNIHNLNYTQAPWAFCFVLLVCMCVMGLND